jgi:ankyrin repeat protein
MYAAQRGYVPMLEVLVQSGHCNVDLTDNTKRTALLHAATRGQLTAVEYLVDKAKANIHLRDNVRSLSLLFTLATC